jgi:hypothetical protein
MSNQVQLPSWALPLILAAVPAIGAFYALEAQSQATDAEVSRVAKVVEKVQESSAVNTRKTALNEQAITVLADKLSESNELAKASDAKLAQLITIMLEQNRN